MIKNIQMPNTLYFHQCVESINLSNLQVLNYSINFHRLSNQIEPSLIDPSCTKTQNLNTVMTAVLYSYLTMQETPQQSTFNQEVLQCVSVCFQ